jgi:Right handed beta helix region
MSGRKGIPMKRPLLIAALMAMPLLLWQQPAKAETTHYVDNVRACAGLTPCYSTIMEAVSAAVPFDSIEVFPGVYHEAVVLDDTKTNVVLKAHIEALKPVIEAPPGQTAVTFQLTTGVQVLNFVLEASEGAGSVFSLNSTDVLLQGNVIKSQGGVSLFGGSANKVIQNTVQGGGILSGGRGCVIARNMISDSAIILKGPSVVHDCVIRHNVVRNGGIAVGSDNFSHTIAFNVVDGGSITISGGPPEPAADNVVRRNVVRRGGIVVRGGGVGGNAIEANFVSGSAEDGILVETEEANIIRRNTSVENAGCDINDASRAGTNVWQKNRFGTKCGSATE